MATHEIDQTAVRNAVALSTAGCPTFHYGLPRGLKELELHGCAARWHERTNAGLTHIFDCATRDNLEPHMLLKLTSLTKLHMGACSYTSDTIDNVAAATNLKHLTFSCPVPELPSCSLATYSCYLSSRTLKRLTNLTHLELCAISPTTGKTWLAIGGSGYPTSDGVIQHLSRLVKLQTLIIHASSMSAHLSDGLEGVHRLAALSRLEFYPTTQRGARP